MTKSQQSVQYITNQCRWMGSYSGNFEPFAFLAKVALEMETSPLSTLFHAGNKALVARALDAVAKDPFTINQAAFASQSLATHCEFYFRILSGKLKPNGLWIDATAKTTAIAALGRRWLDKEKISSVATAYRLMKLDQTRPAAQVFGQLDKVIYKTPIMATGSVPIRDIGDRIAFGRNGVSHGEWSDISFDGVFYGLVTAIVFYNQA